MIYRRLAKCDARHLAQLLCLPILFALAGCAADLVIPNMAVQWSASKSASATIKNQGGKDAGPFEVYFTAEECPNSNNRRPQQSVHVPGLAAGAQLSLAADFQPLAHNDNSNLGRVYSVSVRADPKNSVAEASEFNNWESRATQYDVAALAVFTYNEALATILRGIELDVSAAGELELAPGYYRISQHRVSNDPAQRVVALHIFKSYYEAAFGTSSPPRREEPFVFSIIDQYDYDSTGFRFKGRDFHGHTLAFDIAFQSGCHAVNSVQLNCTAPRLNTKTFLGNALYTCGVTSEPPWSSPLWQ